MRVRGVVLATTVVFVAVSANLAKAADIHVYSSGAPSEAAKVIGVEFAKNSDNHVVVAVGPPAAIQADLTTGSKIDVVILPRPIVTSLTGSGVLRRDIAIDVARVGIGIVVRAGTPAPNITDIAAISRLLSNAHSITYPDPAETGGGSTGLVVARMIEKLGLTDTVRPKLTVKSAIGGGVALVASGAVEVGIFNISEILPVKGVTMVGPLPGDLQNYILFAAAVPVKSTAPEPASAYIKRLADPAARPAWQKAGLEPIDAAH
jgi:molybdate transport system substrate-binding protein